MLREKNEGGMCNYSQNIRTYSWQIEFLEQKAEVPEWDAQPLCGMTLAGKKTSVRKSKN